MSVFLLIVEFIKNILQKTIDIIQINDIIKWYRVLMGKVYLVGVLYEQW